MELRILSIVGPLIKVSITDVKSLILHYICILSFSMAAIFKPSNGGWDPKYRVLSTALAKNHAKPAKGDTSHVTKMNIFCFSQLIMS